MTEEDAKNFMANNNGNLLIHISIVDQKGEPNVTPTAYYFDKDSNKIYIATQKSSKKVHNLRRKNIIYYLLIPIPHTKELEAREKSKSMKTLITIGL
jgi:general stress protein 26